MFGRKKVSIDFKPACYQSMIAAAKKGNSSNSDVINTLIEVFLQSSPDVLQNIGTCCQQRYIAEKEAANALTGYFREEKLSLAEQYLKITEYCGVKLPEIDPGMKKIYLKEGYVIIPEDWIVLPDVYGSADQCMYAGVVESRNCEKYHIPHFVFFSNFASASEYPADLDDRVFASCASVYSDFSRIYNMQRPIPDGDRTDPEGLELIKQWYEAPQFGIFPIEEKEDPTKPAYDPPYGALIVRDV